MLVLSRNLDEEIIINGEIIVKVLGINEKQVKIGIQAPRSVNILRGEVYEKVKQSIYAASQHSTEKPAELGKLKIKKLNGVK
jgi:carbon storage regulator